MTEAEQTELAYANQALLREIVEQFTRIADSLNSPNEYGEVGSQALAGAIARGLRRGLRR